MDYVDTRDIQERIEELQGFIEELEEQIAEVGEKFSPLEDLKSEIGSEFEYGVTLIPVDDFMEHCQELLEDVGDLPKDLPRYIEIDWEATTENMKVDYMEVTYEGNEYYVRI